MCEMCLKADTQTSHGAVFPRETLHLFKRKHHSFKTHKRTPSDGE